MNQTMHTSAIYDHLNRYLWGMKSTDFIDLALLTAENVSRFREMFYRITVVTDGNAVVLEGN